MLRRAVGLIVLASIVSAGCGSGNDPEKFPTYEVKGTVVVKATGKPLTEGSVEFTHPSDSRFNCKGVLDKDGQFTLTTLSGNNVLPGAAEGPYTVTVRRPQGADQIDRFVTLKQTVQVKPEPNTITLELDKAP